ncbi:endonuclease/exonuclease/phosphatase family protein [Pseudonocardia thermophila]|uniref:endonuclease/exonuclease/phosphatase family protein n=1 Tax=Pseudonocardia thermophila TaxID=1848 RepID=UPI00248EA026|nr:endonuclease/exonuclease/phosphatase family protein [Pseudonocardia thermophila]
MRTVLVPAATVAAAVVLHGDRIGLRGGPADRVPMIGLVALRPYLTVATAVAAVGLARRRPRSAAVLGGLAAAAVPSLVRRSAAPVWAPEEPADVTVLAVNVWHGRVEPAAFAALLQRERPDLVALSEAGQPFLDRMGPHLSLLGYRGWTSAPPSAPDGEGVAVLAGPRAGRVQVTGGPELRSRHLRVRAEVLGPRSLVVAHTAAPTTPALARQWREDLAHLARWSHEPVAPIIAGDLNATLDHAALRAVLGPVVSAAAESGHGLTATFPTPLRSGWPALLGIQIDHVLVPAGSAVSRCAVLDVPGSDHRAVLARVRPPRVGDQREERSR